MLAEDGRERLAGEVRRPHLPGERGVVGRIPGHRGKRNTPVHFQPCRRFDYLLIRGHKTNFPNTRKSRTRNSYCVPELDASRLGFRYRMALEVREVLREIADRVAEEESRKDVDLKVGYQGEPGAY